MNITGFSHILNNTIQVDGTIRFSKEGDFDTFSEAAYRSLEVNYPRFHKMDPLCKLGFLGSDILLNSKQLSSKYDPYDVGVVLSNSHSSLDTDLRHLEGLHSGVSSPAVFVYSLPNIVIGEICIRNRFKGENAFFVSEAYDIEGQVSYISQLFSEQALKACVGGWVEKAGEHYHSFIYVVEQAATGGSQRFNTENIKTLYSLTGA